MDVPMLDEEEFEQVDRVFKKCMRSVNAERQTEGTTLDEVDMHARFSPARQIYARITGLEDETHHNAIMHHRISLYGPPCPECGKVTRTPKARWCLECGHAM